MFDKILIGVGILLGSILVIENMVMGVIGYLFLDAGANVGVIVLVSIIIGTSLGYGVRGILKNKNIEEENDEYDF